MRGFRHHCLIVTAVLALMGAPRAAWADCTNPAAPESWTRYDFTAHTLYLCDGTNWLAMAGGTSSGTAGYIQFSNGSGGFSNSGTTAGQQLFWDNTNKRLGIGTVTPATTISMGGEASRNIAIERTSSGTNGNDLYLTAGGAKSATADLNGGSLVFRSGVSTGTGASTIIFQTYTPGTTGTADNTLSTKMIVTGSGNVGIGTTTPSSRLTVDAPNATTTQAELVSARAAIVATNIIGGLDFRSNDTQLTAPGTVSASIQALASASHTASQLATDLTFSTTTGTTFGERMRINAAGNVGIGTTAPSAPLSFGTGINGQKLLLYESGNSRYGFGIQNGEMRTLMQSTASIGLTWGTVDVSDGTTWSEKMRLTKDGNLGIGTATPSTLLEVNGDVKAASYLYSSDRRLKTDVAPLPAQLDKIAALEPVSYVLKSDPERRARLGLIAQDVEAVYPEIVQGQGEAMKAVDYAALVSPLIAAVKELKAANDNLAAEVAALKQQRLTSPVARTNAPQTGTRQPATRHTLNQ